MPYLRLLRLPALFTTFPDVLAGYAIARQGVIVPWELTWLLVASGLLYLSGMVFNDLFDLEQDRRERPTRPLPAGEIPTTTASRLATVLMLEEYWRLHAPVGGGGGGDPAGRDDLHLRCRR